MGGRGMHYRDYRGGYGHHSWWWLVPIVLFKLALFALVVLACLWLARSLRSPAAGAPGAREVLDHRLAEGEISVGEHEQRAARLDPAG